ncbi:hypothetical protein RHSIM_Rhsim03G0018100 [Rhododendron simsii]|uniref:Pentatricopeptide repeat-containing protein n=1 Tax=Rhododendron simsii TaxID=118357 RepID=A0A834HHT7_RHOSS|nr:hypothetical protein RHSIM_Rhsim03G0018100 [Rhododendron simsii]
MPALISLPTSLPPLPNHPRRSFRPPKPKKPNNQAFKNTPHRKQKHKFFLNNDNWPLLLQTSIGSQDIRLSEAIHGFLTKSCYRNNVFRGNNLVTMYVKFNRLDDAQQVFDEMFERNTITWTSLINGYSLVNDVESVVRMTHCMHESEEELNEHTLSVILRAVENPNEIIWGEQIHGFAIKSGFFENVFVGTSLMSMYSRSGRLDDAERLFHELTEIDVRCLNLMISEYANAGCGEKALWVFLELLHSGLEPSEYTFSSVISAGNGTLGLEEGRQLHGLAIKHGLVIKTSVGNAIITMYGRHGLVKDSESMFREMGEWNLVSWTALLSVYVKNGHGHRAFVGFSEMVKRGIKLDSNCLSCVLYGCSECKNLDLGLQIHGLAIKLHMVSCVNVGTALIDLYAKCEKVQSANLFLNSLPVTNTASFNAILTGFTKIEGEGDEDALHLFNRLRLDRLRPDSVTFSHLLSLSADQACLLRGASLHAYAIKAGFEGDLTVSNSVITMYAKCGRIRDAERMFFDMKEHDSVSWNAIISARSIHGQGTEAVSLFEEMASEGFLPDKITILSVLQACSYSGLWNYGFSLFREMELKYGITPILEHFSCMVDLLGKAGRLSEAMDLMNKSPFSDSPLLWRTLVHACKVRGDLNFGKMASKRLLDLEPKEAGSYMLVSNVYAGEGLFDEASKVRTIMNDLNMYKEAGCSWIEIDNKTHKFVASNKNHPENRDIYAKLDQLRLEMENMDGDRTNLIWEPA